PSIDRARFQHPQPRPPVLPPKAPDVSLPPPALGAHHRPDPLPPAQLRRGPLNLRGLITGIGLSDPHIPRAPRRRGPRHHLRTDRQPPITDISPVRTQAPIRPVEIIA